MTAAMPPDATVSIIIPTFNRAAWLAEAVESVLAQGPHVLEILIVDDGSDTIHREALATLCARSPLVRVLALDGRRGRSVARNTGLAQARGAFVLFLDDDDRLGPDMLRTALAHFARTPGLDIVVGLGERFGDVTGAPTLLNPFWVDSAAAPERGAAAWLGASTATLGDLAHHPVRVLLHHLPPTNACLVRRTAIGDTRFAEDLHCGEDRVFWIDLAAAGLRMAVATDARVNIRERPGRMQSRVSADPACRRVVIRARAFGREERFLALAFWARTRWLEGRGDWWRPAIRLAGYPVLLAREGSRFIGRCVFRTWTAR